MKNLFIYLLMLLLPASLVAQETEEPTGFASVSDAAEVAKQIVEASGKKANFAIAVANVQNAVAVLQQGKRYILYNPNFMKAITKVTGTQWAAVSVLAHEIGHHLYAKQVPGSLPKLATELEADEFSGFVLEKMGASLSEAQAAMSYLGSSRASRTHPARADRIASIAKGWTKAGGKITEEDADETIASVRPVPREQTASTTSIAASIYFAANPDGKYFVTKEMNVMSVKNSGLVNIGKVKRSGIDDYPYVIQDESGYKLYVKNSGAIVNRNGRVVGYMKAVSSNDE
jgi:hypothetical protein